MSRLPAAATAAVLVGLLALTAWTDERWLVAVGVLLVQVLVAVAPTPADVRGTVAPMLAPALAAGATATLLALDPTLLAGDGTSRAARDLALSSGVLTGLLPAAAVGVGVALAGQLLRRGERRLVVVTTSHAVTLGVVAALGSGWLAATRTGASHEVVTVAAAGTVVGLLVWCAPWERLLTTGAAVLAGAGAGAVVPLLLDGTTTWVLGVVVGGAAAFCAVLGAVLARTWTGVRVHAAPGWAFPAAVAVALVGPVVHVGSQLVTLSL